MEHRQTIPFGKYKGQPLDVLLSDRKYLEWITGTRYYRFYVAVFHLIQQMDREGENGNT